MYFFSSLDIVHFLALWRINIFASLDMVNILLWHSKPLQMYSFFFSSNIANYLVLGHNKHFLIFVWIESFTLGRNKSFSSLGVVNSLVLWYRKQTSTDVLFLLFFECSKCPRLRTCKTSSNALISHFPSCWTFHP